MAAEIAQPDKGDVTNECDKKSGERVVRYVHVVFCDGPGHVPIARLPPRFGRFRNGVFVFCGEEYPGPMNDPALGREMPSQGYREIFSSYMHLLLDLSALCCSGYLVLFKFATD